MTYQIVQGTFIKRKVDNTPDFATFEDACAFVHDKFAKVLAYFEVDADNEGCADFITTIGGIYTIEAREVVS